MSKNMPNKGIRLHGAPLSEAPENELGVVFLFAKMQEKYGVRVDKIHAGFPDCLARKLRGNRTSIIRIEFEYQSANFKTHGHDPDNCDWIICWEHNWPEVPKNLRVIELRREFGLGWHVWLNPKSTKWLPRHEEEIQFIETVPHQAHVGDLLLIYFRSPLSQIVFISSIVEIRRDDRGRLAGHSGKEDWWAVTKKLCKLKCPLSLDLIRQHKGLHNAGFVRGSFQGRQNITTFWPELYQLIIERNPSIHNILSKYAPEKMDGELMTRTNRVQGVVQEGNDKNV